MPIGSGQHWWPWLAVLLVVLSGCGKPEPFTLEFPANTSLGDLAVVEDVNCFTCENGVEALGPATGSYEVRLPAAHWYVSLDMPRKAAHLLAHLRHPSMTGLGMIDLRGSDVSDSDLANLASIPLRYLYLNETRVTGEGLRYVKAHPRWIRVDLTGCDRLEPEHLSHFRGWHQATIALPYPPGDSRRELARMIICDGQPEDICKTQIR
ncbi:MAG: hypothetical protein R3E68_10800 [Burkholderiaceae bacterium]